MEIRIHDQEAIPIVCFKCSRTAVYQIVYPAFPQLVYAAHTLL